VLTVPQEDLQGIVFWIRNFLTNVRKVCIDGVQSNLIGSAQRVLGLRRLFGDRIGTSVDHYTDQRTINGSASAYRKIFNRSQEGLGIDSLKVPAIFVLNDKGLAHALDEIKFAESSGYNLTLRPAHTVHKEAGAVSAKELENVLISAFDYWFLKGTIIVEPFFGLLQRRLNDHFNGAREEYAVGGCHHQKDCTRRSAHIEPNGDVYLCVEMADLKHLCIGNVHTGMFSRESVQVLQEREVHIADQCGECSYFHACQGGCMAESLMVWKDMYRKSHLCGVWKLLFSRIDVAVDRLGHAEIAAWVDGLDGRQHES
jgi:radical SAM protein with 4Fe4S-binding SPASM domain